MFWLVEQLKYHAFFISIQKLPGHELSRVKTIKVNLKLVNEVLELSSSCHNSPG